MTTVAANLDSMAADHRCTSEGPICHVKKIHLVGDKLYGVCGDVMMGLYVVEWLRGEMDKEALHKAVGIEHRSSITLLELSHEGLALIDGWGVRMPLLDKFYAVGSGAMPAMVELRRGASPSDAVRASLPLDDASGLHPDHPPTVESLPPKSPQRKRKR